MIGVWWQEVPLGAQFLPGNRDLPLGPASVQILGTFTVNSGTLTVTLTNAANEFVIADAVRIERVGFAGRILDNGESGYTVTPGWTLLDDTQFGSFQGVAVAPRLRARPTQSSGSSATISFSPSRASDATGWPSATTWPRSKRSPVTTPA